MGNQGVWSGRVYPPLTLTRKPFSSSALTRVSLWSPWISMMPSLMAPPVPHRFLRSLARSRSASEDTGTPSTRVTVLPFRPRRVRLTRTIPSPVGGGAAAFFFLHRHRPEGAPQWGQSLPCSDEKTILSSSCLPIGSVLPGFFRVRCDEAVHAVRSENRRRWSTMMQRSWITVIPASRSFWADGPWWIPSWVQTARGRGERARISST